jgi:hypothetical protein
MRILLPGGLLAALLLCGCEQQRMLQQAEAPNMPPQPYYESILCR